MQPPSSAAAAPNDAEIRGAALQEMAEVMDLEFPLEEADWEMLAAGPADDVFNVLLDKEVLQQLALFGNPIDGDAAGAAGEAPPPGLVQPGGGLSGLGGLLQPGGGISGVGGLGNAAKQIKEMLAGTHPSMRGTSLEDWLAADGPIVAITNSGLPGDMHASPAPPAPAERLPAGAAAPHGSAAAAAAGSDGMPAAGAAPATLLAEAAAAPAHQAPVAPAPPTSTSPPKSSGAPLDLQAQLAQMATAALLHGTSMDFGGAAAPAAPAPAPAPPFGSLAFPPMPDLAPQPAAAGWQAAVPDMASLTPSGGSGITPSASSGAIGEGGGAGGALGMVPQQLLASPGAQFGLPAMPPPSPQFSQAPLPAGSLGGGSLGLGGVEEDLEEAGSGGGFVQGAGDKPATLKKFRDRQQARIAMIEQELAKLQRDMHRMKVENVQLKSKNAEMEQQLRSQQPIQQLAAAVTSASAAAAAAQHQRGEGGAGEGGPGASPPNSQEKLLLQLNDSMRPQDREMMAVAALSWPKLHEWYTRLMARFRDALARAPGLTQEEADRAAKEALRSGRYWDLLVLISRPDLSTRLLSEDLSAPPSPIPPAAAGGAAAAPAAAPAWPAAAVQAMALSPEQRAALAAAWQRHREAAELRAARKQELLTAIRGGFLVHLQRASPEDIELGKPLARQGLGAMEALRLVVRQEHVSTVTLACGLRKLLQPLQQAALAAAAWPWYPDPAKWAPLLADAAGEGQQA